MNIRTYVYGVTDDAKEFLHSFLDEAGAMTYIRKHTTIFPNRYSSYSLYYGDECYKNISVEHGRTDNQKGVS